MSAQARDGSRAKLTIAEREARRRVAVEKVLAGLSQREVAEKLGVNPSTVAGWMLRYREGGLAGLSATPITGRPRSLTTDQEKQILAWLEEKPEVHGFPYGPWTAKRVCELIYHRFGVRFSMTYMWRWLSDQRRTTRKAVTAA